MAMMNQLDGILWHAASDGDIKRAEYAIARGADVNVMPRGVAAIHRAAAAGHLELCRLLLDAGADISPMSDSDSDSNITSGNGTLHSIVEAGSPVRLDILRFFLERGAAPDQRRVTDEATALHVVARKSDDTAVAAINMLAEFGACPNVGDVYALVPLHRAISSFECVRNARALVAIGADPGYRAPNASSGRLSPFQSAVQRGNRELIEYYIAECGQSLSQLAPDGRTMRKLASATKEGLEIFLSIRSREAILAGFELAKADESVASPSRSPRIGPL